MTPGEGWRDTTAEAAAAVLSAVVEHAGLGIALVGPDGRPFQVNPCLCRMLGYREDELIALPFADVTHPDDVSLDSEMFAEMRAGTRDVYRVEKRYLRRDGAVVWAALTVSAVCRATGGLQFAVGIVEDITVQRRLKDELRHQAMHDHLTGLPNRRLFDDRLAHARGSAKRNKHGLALIALDLDRFKAVNDEFGHAAGDEVLVHVAKALTAACRESDTVARLGGDEYAVICQGRDVALHAYAMAQRFRTALCGPLVLAGGTTVNVSASVGVAVADGTDSDRALLLRADSAMYAHKHDATPRLRAVPDRPSGGAATAGGPVPLPAPRGLGRRGPAERPRRGDDTA